MTETEQLKNLIADLVKARATLHEMCCEHAVHVERWAMLDKAKNEVWQAVRTLEKLKRNSH